MNVRVLNESDAADFQSLRLRALQEHPEAFGMAYEEELETPMERVIDRLRNGLPDSPTFGAFVDGRLAGTVGLNRSNRAKQRHRAMIWGMYVTPEARGAGAGKALLDAALAYARTLPGLEDVVLAVTVGNEAARALYIRAGFTPYSVEPRYIKLGDRYYDIEWMILSLLPEPAQ